MQEIVHWMFGQSYKRKKNTWFGISDGNDFFQIRIDSIPIKVYADGMPIDLFAAVAYAQAQAVKLLENDLVGHC